MRGSQGGKWKECSGHRREFDIGTNRMLNNFEGHHKSQSENNTVFRI